MAWPSDPAAGGVISAAYIKSIKDSVKAWPGQVDAQNNPIVNLGNLAFGAGAGIVQDAWTALSFSNSWVNFGAPYTSGGSRLDKQGRVWLCGTIKNGTYTDGTTVFTLPAGQRPATSKQLTAGSYNGTTRSTCALVVASTGVVSVYGATGNLYMLLDGISFDLS